MKIVLKKCDMNMKCVQCKAIFALKVPVELWSMVGLAIHETTTGWRVSHYSSGKAVIKGIPDRTIAVKVMARLYREVLQDWTTSESHLKNTVGWSRIEEKRNEIQKEIKNGNEPSGKKESTKKR